MGSAAILRGNRERERRSIIVKHERVFKIIFVDSLRLRWWLRIPPPYDLCNMP